MPDAVRVLGIDPGVSTTGYGVVEVRNGSLIALTFGAIHPPSRSSFPGKLRVIYRALREIIEEYRPGCVAVEDLFFAKNVKTALRLGQARGVALLAAVEVGLPVFTYSPLAVKGAVTGFGGAAKGQVQRMVASLLRLPVSPHPVDAADALAVAICHIHGLALQTRMAKGVR